MSLLSRTLPIVALRSKSLLRDPLPVFFLSFSKPIRNISLATRCVCSASAPPSSLTDTPTSDSTITPSIPFHDKLEWVNRTGFCGELSEVDVGKRVRLCGWVAFHRLLGGITFLNLRDHTGIVQVTTLPDKFPDAHSILSHLRLEYVVSVEGVVRSRPHDAINKKMKTGMIEVVAENLQMLNAVRSKLPFLVTSVDDAKDSAKEEIRLRRY